MQVELRYWAAARSAAGRERDTIEAASAAEAWDIVCANARGTELERVLAVSSLLVDGVRRSVDDLAEVGAPAVIEVLPPFAGG